MDTGGLVFGSIGFQDIEEERTGHGAGPSSLNHQILQTLDAAA